MRAVGGSGGSLAFYNCGKSTGFTQAHRHVQILPRLEHMPMLDKL
jgi:ATP adenylyltransferase/5',5'''-P-1,P-4-tetraphosphate phosphorylase II